jgi:hypothetical protein
MNGSKNLLIPKDAHESRFDMQHTNDRKRNTSSPDSILSHFGRQKLLYFEHPV